MDLKKLLNKELICFDLCANDKVQVISGLIDRAYVSGKVRNKAEALNAVLKRETLLPTAVPGGIALPHGKTSAVDELVLCLGIIKDGIDFGSVDGELSNIMVLSLSPESMLNEHLEVLSYISKILSNKVFKNKILEASTSSEVVDIIQSISLN